MSIQGQILDITVVGCYRLKDTEWISRQDPYVCVEYIGNRFRTRTCTDGGKNPVFQEKFRVTMVEGARELKIAVWNSNTMSTDDFIGSGTVSLQNVLTQGFEDSTWTLQTKSGRHAGEMRLILHFANVKSAQKTGKFGHPSAPPQVQMYIAPPVTSPYAPPTYYQAPPQYTSYPPQHSAYPPQPSAYPPQPSAYPPQLSPYPPQLSPYPPQTSPYPPPPSTYPPPPSTYPPPPASNYPPSQCYNQGPYPGTYPPPPY